MKDLQQSELKKLFSYNIITGKLRWKISRSSSVKIGQEAGFLSEKGYRKIKLNKKQHKGHRIIWIMMIGDIPEGMEPDHVDGMRDNNKPDNIRLVTHQENQFNRPNAKGYYWHKRDNAWRARIRVGGKDIDLGSFVVENDARRAYSDGKALYHVINRPTIADLLQI